mmetsp:Transcript_14469/g.32349  ORF Transcript_14469/g.32349 Transcript_14469/m.32349 type:complete len:203 (+) Transcript_14469:40-648(+)
MHVQEETTFDGSVCQLLTAIARLEFVEGSLQHPDILWPHVRAVHFEVGLQVGSVGREQLVHDVQERQIRRPGDRFLELGIERLDDLPRLVEHRRDRLHVDIQPLLLDKGVERREVEVDRHPQSLLDVRVSGLFDGAENAFAAVDFAEHEEDSRAARDRCHHVVEVVLGEEDGFGAQVVALEPRNQLRHQHCLLALHRDHLPG